MMDVEGQHSIKSPKNNLELDLMWDGQDETRNEAMQSLLRPTERRSSCIQGTMYGKNVNFPLRFVYIYLTGVMGLMAPLRISNYLRCYMNYTRNKRKVTGIYGNNTGYNSGYFILEWNFFQSIRWRSVASMCIFCGKNTLQFNIIYFIHLIDHFFYFTPAVQKFLIDDTPFITVIVSF